MRDRDWKERFRAWLYHPAYQFEPVVRSMLLDIREAEQKDRPALAASYGGFIRSHQGGARIILAKAMMEQLHITTTQHVAFFVMKEVFKSAASTEALNASFAKSGRTANERHMTAARKVVHARQDQVGRYAGLYRWYCRLLDRRLASIKSSLR